MQVITVTAFYRIVHCSRLHHTCSFLCDLVAAILVFLAVSEICPLQWWQPNFLLWYMSMEGRKSSRKSSIKSGDFMQQYMSLKCYLHTLLSHKMALALCAQLAHLSVLKLSSELHRGGTGRVQTSDRLHTALWLVRFPPSNRAANSNSRFCLVPPTLTSL